NEPAKSSTSSSSSSSTSSSQSGTTGAGTKNGGSTTSTSGARTYPDHAIYNASKEQLQALPQFDYNKQRHRRPSLPRKPGPRPGFSPPGPPNRHRHGSPRPHN